MELAANAVNALSIVLAGRNSVHTWWTGIVGCILFGVLFYSSQLYADATLQVFFIVTSITGWWTWLRGAGGEAILIRRTRPQTLILLVAGGAVVTAGYGWILHSFTDAYAPFIDSIVLAFSVIAQFLLMGRRLETWWFWLLVNTVAVPLYISRELYITAILYTGFWVNALISLRYWSKQVEA